MAGIVGNIVARKNWWVIVKSTAITNWMDLNVVMSCYFDLSCGQIFLLNKFNSIGHPPYWKLKSELRTASASFRMHAHILKLCSFSWQGPQLYDYMIEECVAILFYWFINTKVFSWLLHDVLDNVVYLLSRIEKLEEHWISQMFLP